METRTLELSIISVKGLRDDNLVSNMEVCAVVTLLGDPWSKQIEKTTVDREGGNPSSGNSPMKFIIHSQATKLNSLILEIKLRCPSLRGHEDGFEVNIPVDELAEFDDGNGDNLQYVSYKVSKPSGMPKGQLNIAYKFGQRVIATEMATTPPAQPKGEPEGRYPAPGVSFSSIPCPSVYHAPPSALYPQTATGSYAHPPPVRQVYAAYPPPPPGYGYHLPPAPGYGYQPPPPGYGYAPPPPGYRYPPPPAYGYHPVQQQKSAFSSFCGMLGSSIIVRAITSPLFPDEQSNEAGHAAASNSSYPNGNYSSYPNGNYSSYPNGNYDSSYHNRNYDSSYHNRNYDSSYPNGNDTDGIDDSGLDFMSF